MARRNLVKEDAPLLEPVVDPLVEEISSPRMTLAQADDAVRAVEVEEEPEPRAIARQVPADEGPAGLMRLAITQGANIEVLERLMAMQLQWDAVQAEKAFWAAMKDFQSQIPRIPKRKKVHFETRDGDIIDYNYADLGDIEDIAKGPMAQCGLSRSYKIEDTEDNKLRVTCIASHIQGHKESASIKIGLDASGKKNAIQQAGSSLSYGKRLAFCAVFGVSGVDDDIDARLPSGETITDEEVNSLRDLIKELNTDEAKFLKFMELTCSTPIQRIEDIPDYGYRRGVQKLREVKAEQAKSLVTGKEKA